jgi:predicted nuclease of predicted toxin-antitoxin system
VRFYLDEHIPKGVVEGLRRRGVNVLTVQEAGRSGDSDEKQLAFAAREGRVLVTFDDDFLRLDATGVPHAGIVFSQTGRCTVGKMIERLMVISSVIEPSEMKNHIEFI